MSKEDLEKRDLDLQREKASAFEKSRDRRVFPGEIFFSNSTSFIA